MKLLNVQGFSFSERESHKTIIYDNMLKATKDLVSYVKDNKLEITCMQDFEKICSYQDESFEFSKLADSVSNLWKDKVIQNEFESNHFIVKDNAKYFLQKLVEICQSDYIPTDEDILLCNSRTNGTSKLEFYEGRNHFVMYEFEGSKELGDEILKKYFGGASAVLFFVSLGEYDLQSEEGNRLILAEKLFEKMCKDKNLDVHVPIVLFFTKKDVFYEKLKKRRLDYCYPDYKGKNDFEEASKFIKSRFLRHTEMPQRIVHVNFICTIDPTQIKHIFKGLSNMLIEPLRF